MIPPFEQSYIDYTCPRCDAMQKIALNKHNKPTTKKIRCSGCCLVRAGKTSYIDLKKYHIVFKNDKTTITWFVEVVHHKTLSFIDGKGKPATHKWVHSSVEKDSLILNSLRYKITVSDIEGLLQLR